MASGVATVAVALVAAIAITVALGGGAEAQSALTYTAASTTNNKTVVTFAGGLQLDGSPLGTSSAPPISEWKVYDTYRRGSALPDTPDTERTVSSARVLRAGSSPQIELTHIILANSPYPIVKYEPGAMPSLAGSSAAVSTAAVVATPSLPAFTAEVLDGALVRLTFETDAELHATNGPSNAPGRYAAFNHDRTLRDRAIDAGSAVMQGGYAADSFVTPTGWDVSDIESGTLTLNFAGSRAADLLTSTPFIVYGYGGASSRSPMFSNTAGIMLNATSAIATDNASPVAFASFEDADTIMVEFSEEMSTPSAQTLDGVTVTGPGGAAAVSGTPAFTAHTAAGATTPFGRPTLEITLDSPATPGTHTLSFPGFSAAGGPAGKRSVADATIEFADTFPPTFTAEVRDGGQIVLTFSKDVRREAGRAVDDGHIYHYTYAPMDLVSRPGSADRANQPGVNVDPSSVAFTDSTSTMTLTFAGDAQRGLLTSTPHVAYTYNDVDHILEDTRDNLLANQTLVRAEDNASPVAFASFTDARTIEVQFSEEMATPTDAALDAVEVTAGGAAVATSRPVIMNHAEATTSSPFGFPTLAIALDSAAAVNVEHTISFPQLRAAAGPADKRAVADATATLTDAVAPTFVVHKLSNTRLMVTFSEEVMARPATTAALDDWSINTTPAAMSATVANPTEVTLGHNFADLTIAAVGDAVLPTVRYVESTATIEDLAGNALGVTAEDAAVAAVAAPIPLSAAHTRTSTGATQVTVTFSENIRGTTTAADWSVDGAASLMPAFTASSSTVTLTGFTLAPGATPDVAYSGTTLTEDTATSPATVPAREVRATDGIAPLISLARTESGTQIRVAMSEGVAFATAGTGAADTEATGHWRTVLGSAETEVESVEVSGSMVTLTVAGEDAWQTSEAPDVKYTRDVTGADAGRIVDANGNELADATFTETTDGADFAVVSIATADELTDIMDQRDPADNVHAEYVVVTLSEDVSFTSGTQAQRIAHWTVRDDEASPPADVAVTEVDFVAGSARDVRLTLVAGALSGTAATPAVSYSQAMSAGRLLLASDSAVVASFGPTQAADGIPPRLVAYPEAALLPDYKASERHATSTLVPAMGAAAECTMSNVPAGCPELDMSWLTTVSGEKGIAFTFSEPIDPASVGGSREIPSTSMRLQLAAGDALRGLTGNREVALNNGETGTLWLPFTIDLLRAEDSGGAHTTFATGAIIPDRTNSGGDRDDDNPRAPASSPALGAGGNVVTYVMGTSSGTISSTTTTEAPAGTFTTRLEYPPTNEDGEVSRPRQNIYGFFYSEAGAPRDAAGNAYRTNVHVDSVHGTPADAADPAAYDQSTRGIHGTFIVATDIEAPHFRATAVSPTTVRAVYMEPVRLVDGAAQMAASHWRLDTTPNDDTDNTDGATWITPTGIETTFGAFERPEYLAFGAPDHTTPTDSRLTVTLTGFTGLDPHLQSASTDTRPYLYYVAPPPASGMDPTSAVEDMYGNRAPQESRSRVVDATVAPTAAFTDESTIVVDFGEELAATPTNVFVVNDAAGEQVMSTATHANADASATPPRTSATTTLALAAPAGEGAHTVRIAAGAEIADVASPSGTLAPRSWFDRTDDIGSASTGSLPGNLLALPATIPVAALPALPTFTAATSSLTRVDVMFSEDMARVGDMPAALAAGSWAVEAGTAGQTERTVTTSDDIAVSAVEAVQESGMPITGVTLTLDENSTNIGDTSKVVYVTYVASTPELRTAPASGITRSLAAGTSALSTDNAPPLPTAEITSLTEITLTFAEAPTLDPTRTGISYSVTAPDNTNDPDDADTDPDAIALHTTTPLTYTMATPTAPATVVLTSMSDLASAAYTVTITSTAADPDATPVVEAVRIADANGAQLPLSHDVVAPAPAAPTFTAATSSNTEILVTFDQPVMLADMVTALTATDWIVDPSGKDDTMNDAMDDITVSSAALAGRTVTLTLDSTDMQLGDTAKKPYVEYTASTAEIENLFGTGVAAGTSATAADGVAPTATAAFTAEDTVTLTFSEALASDPAAAAAGNTFGVYEVSGSTDLADPDTAPTYTAAASGMDATLAITLAAIPAAVAHEVRIGGTGSIDDMASPANTLDKSAAVNVPALPTLASFAASSHTESLVEVDIDLDDFFAYRDGTGVTNGRVAIPKASWAAEVATMGQTARTPETTDDIAVAEAYAFGSSGGISRFELILDADDANIGDTSKDVFVTYISATPEFRNAPADLNAISRTLVAGTGVLAADGAAPVPTAMVTGSRTITLTFPEALTADPTGTGITYQVYTEADRTDQTTNLIATTSPTSYTAAATGPPATPDTVAVSLLADIGAGAHVVVIRAPMEADRISDGTNFLNAVTTVTVPEPPAPTFTASATSWTEVELTFDVDVALVSGTTALEASNWLVDPDGADGMTNDGADDINVTSAALDGRTLTLTLNPTSANIGDTAKMPYVEYTASTAEIASTLGTLLAQGTSAVATDDAPPQITAVSTGSTLASRGADPADPADNVHNDHITVTLSEPVIVEAGTAAQRAGHWIVTDDDPDGSGSMAAPAVAVTDAALDLVDAADTSSRFVRLSLGGPLSGTAATPSVSYDPATAAAGRLVLPGAEASASTLVASATGLEASDGIGPRLTALPVRGDLTPATPADDDGRALVFTFSEALDPASLDTMTRATVSLARLQIDAGSPTGYRVPQRHDDSCATGTTWLPTTHSYATTTAGSDTVADLADIVTNDMGVMERGTLSNTVRVSSPSYGDSNTSQRIHWLCFNSPGGSLEAFASSQALLDAAGNPYVPAEESPHSQYFGVGDVRAPEFGATVTDADTILVVYDEPVALPGGAASLSTAEWRVDTTPLNGNDNMDGTTWLTPTAISHSFSQMLQPEYWAYGPPGHVPTVPPGTYPEARLTIELTLPDGTALDPNQVLLMNGSDPRPRVTYTAADSTTPDVVDVYGNAAASPGSAQTRDSIPPMVEAISVGVTTASTASAPVPDAQHARASAASPVDIRFAVTLNEAPKPGTPPVLGVLTNVSPSTTLPAATSSQDTQRLWAMTETADAADGHTWEYTWTVTNMLPGETGARDWAGGFGLFYGIVATDTADNAAAYTQNSRVPGGDAFPAVVLDSQAPVVRATSMVGMVGDPPTTLNTGRDGSAIELRFTVDERPSRLVTATEGAGGAVTFSEGIGPSAVTFFSGADEVQATTLSPVLDDAGTHAANAEGVYEYVATATIPAGHAEGTDAVEWSISVLDIFGQEGTTDHGDIGTTGHAATLGFTVDNTAPMIVDASSSVGTDDTGGTRAATDALSPWARGGEAMLVDVTFDEPVYVRDIADVPKVRGHGVSLAVPEDGPARREAVEYHAMEPMVPVDSAGADATAVAGMEYTRWRHSWTVPDSATAAYHDATYVADILMPMDEAGNTMTFTGFTGGAGVRIDNVAPSLRELTRFVDGMDSMGRAGQWIVIEYVEHAGLLTGSTTATPPDDLRAYMNDTRAELRFAGEGTLMLFPGLDSGGNVPCFTQGMGGCNQSGFRLTFGYGGDSNSATPTGLTDLAGNAVTYDAPQPENPGGGTFGVDPEDPGYATFPPELHAGTGAPLAVTSRVGTTSVDLSGVGLDAAGGDLDFDIVYEAPAPAGAEAESAGMRAQGVSVLLQAGTRASGLGSPPEIALTPGAGVHALPGEPYYTALLQDEDHEGEDEQALRSLASSGARAVVVAGRADAEVLLSLPARITIPGAADAAYAYWLQGADTPAQGDDSVNMIPECAASTATEAHADDIRSRGADVSMYDTNVKDECYVRDRGDGSMHIWTNHFTPFGASAEALRSGGGGDCDDCTPPTLGVDSTGARRVAGGFTYNGASHDVLYYYTPMPLIEVETGVENVAVLKIFEDSGVSRLSHAGLAFGLGRGQHFAESEAEIMVSISHTGELAISLDDESGAIDPETLRASYEVVECMQGSSAECAAITIHHTFREPLEFDVVSTNVWDTRRNAWQNFYNHGVHVGGESLNPSRGVEVNGGTLVLYPLISEKVDADGDGTYDYDERHVTYMLDESYGVWRLTPDGTYAPLRNLAALHHEVDDSMWADSRIRTHGAERSSALFAEALSAQEEIARGIMAELGIGVPEREAPEAAPSPYDGMAAPAPRLERLGEAIAAEINVAERLMGQISPALAKSR